jgi:EF-hand domain pair/EF hand
VRSASLKAKTPAAHPAVQRVIRGQRQAEISIRGPGNLLGWLLGNLRGDRDMSKIATCVVMGAIMLVCTYSARADELVTFATGGYAEGLRTKDMMHKMDTNHDGMLSRDEWIAWQEKVFAMLDKNKNGKVDVTEFISARPTVVSFATGGYASGLCTKEMFDKIDVDGDGTISRKEFINNQLKIFDKMDTSTVHKGMLGPEEFFATGGKPAY